MSSLGVLLPVCWLGLSSFEEATFLYAKLYPACLF